MDEFADFLGVAHEGEYKEGRVNTRALERSLGWGDKKIPISVKSRRHRRPTQVEMLGE